MLNTPSKPPRTTAKLFMHGRSQAVRLPREYRLPGTEVEISKVGDCVMLKPKVAAPIDAARIFAQLDAIEPLSGFMEDRYDGLVEPTPVDFDK